MSASFLHETSDARRTCASRLIPSASTTDSTVGAPGEQPAPREPAYPIGLYERALRRDPRNHFLLLDLAQAYAQHEWRAEAEAMLRHVSELYPNSTLVQLRAAELYRKLDRWAEAIQRYRRVLELEPQHPRAAEILAELSPLARRLGS